MCVHNFRHPIQPNHEIHKRLAQLTWQNYYDISWQRTESTKKKLWILYKRILACESVNFWTIVSLPTLILRVDKARLRSSMLHPINLATVIKAAHKWKITGEITKSSSSNRPNMNHAWFLVIFILLTLCYIISPRAKHNFEMSTFSAKKAQLGVLTKSGIIQKLMAVIR